MITDYDLKGVPARLVGGLPRPGAHLHGPGTRSGHTYEIAVRVWNAKGKHSPYTATVPGTPDRGRRRVGSAPPFGPVGGQSARSQSVVMPTHSADPS